MLRRLLTIVVCLIWASVSGAAPGDPECALDFDGSGVVDEDDFFYCQQVIVLPGSPHPCDTNGDGLFTTLEIGQILAAISDGPVDCTTPVPTASRWLQGLLLAALAIAGATAIRSTRRAASAG